MPIYMRGLDATKLDMPGVSQIFDDKSLRDLLYGLGFGGSGGGGGYTIGEALVEAIIAEIPVYKRVMYDVSEASDTDFAVMAGGIGAPSAITPQTITKFADYAWAAISAYSKEQGKKVNAILPVEAGPVNALLALYLAWKYGLKVFDCDGDGRAVPSLTNLVFGYNDYPISPMYLAGVKQGSTTISANVIMPPPKDAAAAEGAIRDNLGVYNNAAGLVCWGQTGAQLKNSKYLIKGQFKALTRFGSQTRALSGSEGELYGYLSLDKEMVQEVFLAQLVEIQTDSRPGYDDGTLIFKQRFPETGAIRSIKYENENMLMTSNRGDPAVTAPNGIAMLFQKSGQFIPLNNGDDLQNAGVIGVKAMVVVLKEHCMLYSGDIGNSFLNVLRSDPFNYTGPIQPTNCIK